MNRLEVVKDVLRRTTPGAVAAFRMARLFVANRRMSLGNVFTDIFARNDWGSAESRSGPGSELDATGSVRRALPALLSELQVRILLDVPCGDLHWMKEVALDTIRYIGADIVPELIADNATRFRSTLREFIVLDLTRGPLPQADLVLCRDCFIHFSYRHIRNALRTIRASGSTYLLATTNPRVRQNHDIITGSYRPINLERPPFGFPPPIRYLAESPVRGPGPGDERHQREDCLGLWRIRDLPSE